MTIILPSAPASYLMMGSGVSWTGNANQSATVSYSFADFPSDSMTAMNFAQQTAATAAMQQWANVANLTFTQSNGNNGGNANILFGQEDLPPFVLGATSFFTSGSRMLAADVAMDTATADYSVGGSGFTTMVHEVGHALGLDHPADYGQGETLPFIPANLDSTDLTVMSYFDGNYTEYGVVNPTGPMLYDIAAVQYLYGANRNYHSGNDVYTIDGTAKAYALWDGAGNDTIDSSSYDLDTILDLREGNTNVNDVGSSAVWVAFGANIENAVSGDGNDQINGNALNNILSANAGNDTITGNDGNDTIDGGAGNDNVQGNVGNDSVSGGDGDDLVRGGKGSDYIQGNLGNDIIMGDVGSDTLRGGQGSDEIHGGADVDVVYGDKGNDTLYGEEGNDVFKFTLDGGHDTIFDFTGAGAIVGDVLEITAAFSNAVNGLLDDITYDGHNAVIALDANTNITLIGVASGLVASDFHIV